MKTHELSERPTKCGHRLLVDYGDIGPDGVLEVPSQTIIVTRSHLRNGKRHHNRKCPLALAMQDAGYEQPSVNSRHITWQENGQTRGRTITAELAGFTQMCDSRLLRPLLLLKGERRFVL